MNGKIPQDFPFFPIFEEIERNRKELTNGRDGVMGAHYWQGPEQ